MPARVCFGSKKSFARGPAKLELKSWICADFDPLRDAELVADRVAVGGGEAWLAEGRSVHRKRAIASTCAERMRKSVVSG